MMRWGLGGSVGRLGCVVDPHPKSADEHRQVVFDPLGEADDVLAEFATREISEWVMLRPIHPSVEPIVPRFDFWANVWPSDVERDFSLVRNGQAYIRASPAAFSSARSSRSAGGFEKHAGRRRDGDGVASLTIVVAVVPGCLSGLDPRRSIDSLRVTSQGDEPG